MKYLKIIIYFTYLSAMIDKQWIKASWNPIDTLGLSGQPFIWSASSWDIVTLFLKLSKALTVGQLHSNLLVRIPNVFTLWGIKTGSIYSIWLSSRERLVMLVKCLTKLLISWSDPRFVFVISNSFNVSNAEARADFSMVKLQLKKKSYYTFDKSKHLNNRLDISR